MRGQIPAFQTQTGTGLAAGVDRARMFSVPGTAKTTSKTTAKTV